MARFNDCLELEAEAYRILEREKERDDFES